MNAQVISMRGAEISLSPYSRLSKRTRANLSHDLDPRLVSAALSMTEGGALHYVTDAVDAEATMFPADGDCALTAMRTKETAGG